MSLIELFEMGGPFMWPILILLVLTISLALERLIYYAWTYSAPGEPDDFVRRGDLTPPQSRSLLDRILPDSRGRFERFAPVRLVINVRARHGGSGSLSMPLYREPAMKSAKR